MFLRQVCAFTALASLLAARPASAADAPKDIIQKAIEASGGKDVLNKYPAQRTDIKGVVHVMGLDVEFSGKSAHFVPGRERTEMSMEIGGNKVEIVQVINGDKVKMTANGQEAPLSDAMKEELREGAVMAEAYQLTPLLDDKKFEVKALDNPPKVGGKETVGVTVSAKGLKETKMIFEKESGLLVKIERTGIDQMNEQQVKQELYLKDHKKVQGMMTPHKLEIKQDGKDFLEMTFSSIEMLEKIDPKEFDVSD